MPQCWLVSGQPTPLAALAQNAALTLKQEVDRGRQETTDDHLRNGAARFCHLAGLFLGDLLGVAIGVKTNVGGVGIAMLLLIFPARLYLHGKGLLPKETEAGVGFWGAMYIPVVVAMAANQNVVAALKGGPGRAASALGAVAVCWPRYRGALAHRTRQHLVHQRPATRRDLTAEQP